MNESRKDFWPRNTLIVTLGGEQTHELEEHTVMGNILRYEWERYLYGPTWQGEEIVIVDITPVVENQIALLWITFVALIVSSGVGYLVSVFVVKKSLRDLKVLAQKAQTIDVDSLQQSRTFPHLPDHDEIQIVSHALQEMTEKIHIQVTAIKQFVANVSHEFKTPLMSLQSAVDVGEKVKQYDQLFPQIREQIGTMHRLLDTLTTLMHSQKTSELKKEQLVIAPMVTSIVDAMRLLHTNITFTNLVEDDVSVVAHQGIVERILSNLLDNAAKFTPAWWTVTITATNSSLTISDTWAGISPEQLTRIREPFWQWDAARGTMGFWLGLALVKQCVTLLDRDIVVKSTVGEWTIVKLTR